MDKEAKGKWSEESIKVIQPNHPDLKKKGWFGGKEGDKEPGTEEAES